KAITTASISSGHPSLRHFISRVAHNSQNGTLIRRLAGIGTAVSEPVRKQSGHSAGNSYDFLATVTALQSPMRTIITLNVERVGPTCIYTETGWETAAVRGTRYPRPGGGNGGTPGARTYFRSRPAAGTVCLSERPQRTGRSPTRPQADQHWPWRNC